MTGLSLEKKTNRGKKRREELKKQGEIREYPKFVLFVRVKLRLLIGWMRRK